MDRSQAGKLGYEKTKHILDQRRSERSQRILEEYEANPKHCPQCGEKIIFERRHTKFCNCSCAATYNNRGARRHIKRSQFCSCGNPKTLQNQYCDQCIQNRVYNKIFTLDEAKSDRTRKNLIIKERGSRCEVCGITEWMGKPINVELDHIDGDVDNNAGENLRLICPNCHSQTNTYKGANRGKNSARQQMRRQRYADGKTY
jgi:DNA-directed RNA polymerase subunit RPC12/RpoP